MADGPVIQRASERALRHHVGIADVLQVVSEARTQTDVPIILFSYFNPLLQWCRKPDREEGHDSLPQDLFVKPLPDDGAADTPAFDFEMLARSAVDAGLDGVLVTDLVPEEAADFAKVLRKARLDMIFLIAPTSTDERLKLVAERAGGFIYAVSRAGITGARAEMSAEAEKLVNRMRAFSDLPIAVGFGISKPEHVRDVWRYADAAVVGSAIVDVIERSGNSENLVKSVGDFAKHLINRS